MAKKESKLQKAQKNADAAVKKTNRKIEELGQETSKMHYELNNIQELFDLIRNIPSDKKLQLEELKKVRLNWKRQVEKIEADYKEAAAISVGAINMEASIFIGW